ncbi:HNH endonuclease protein [Rhizobium phage RHph_Y1_10]|nr:HNH endonuclease protein [Rhizobium phage RHph_Y1_10]
MAERQLTQEYVRSLFEYDPETGVLTWKERPREHFSSDRIWRGTNTRCVGKAAGGLDTNGYVEVGIDGKIYKAHRVIWLLVTGEWPDEIDHDDGVRDNNRFKNLKNGSHGGNMLNKSQRRDNKSGVCGVGWHKIDRRWVAHITVKGKQIRLGGFVNLEDAVAARLDAEVKYGFGQTHGRRASVYPSSATRQA